MLKVCRHTESVRLMDHTKSKQSAQPRRPTPMSVNSGPPAGGDGGFIIRVSVLGPAVRVIVVNNGGETYQFSVYGYATS